MGGIILAKFNKTELKHAALAVFEQPNGITWHEVVALLDFFDDVRAMSDQVSSSRIRLIGVLDYLRAAATITAEQYNALAKLANEIE